MFVSRKVVFEKLFFKLSCICLSQKNWLTENIFRSTKNIFRSTKNTFESTENTFRSTENTFQSILIKEKFDLVFRKVFSLQLYVFFEKQFPRNHFPNFLVFVFHWKSWSMENTFQSKENLTWFSGKCFPGKFGRKTLCGSCEKFRNVILFADYI